MQFKNYFILAARIIGLFAILNGARSVIDLIFIWLDGSFDSIIVAYILAVTLFYLIGGFYLLQGAPAIIRIAFGRKSDETVFERDE